MTPLAGISEIPRGEQHLRDFEQFRLRVFERTGLNLRQYRFEQTYRRIWVMAARANCASFSEYCDRLLEDPAGLRAFMDRLAINVTELFRNPEQFALLKHEILPDLLARSKALRVWSAGCSDGAEAYSVAALLEMLAPGRPHLILGTDIDQEALERARRAEFSDGEMRCAPPTIQAEFFAKRQGEHSAMYVAGERLRNLVRFQAQNILADRAAGRFDMIVCRNVVIYFEEDAKQTLYRRFFEALKPGGYLFVGSTERICQAERIGYAHVRPFFYQRPRLAFGG